MSTICANSQESNTLSFSAKLYKAEQFTHPQTDSMFDLKLFRADQLLRSQDAFTSAKLWSNPYHCYNELDPIAPGPNHPNWMTYAFQATASVGIAQGYNMLYKHNHKKLARVFLIADVISESVAVANNYRNINNSPATKGVISNAPVKGPSATNSEHDLYQHSGR